MKDIVLVTGSSGLIGSAAIRRLADGYCMVGFDRASGSHRPPSMAECVCIDLTQEDSLALGLERVRYGYGDRIASVIHLAAYYDFSGEPSPLYEQVTLRGTERLLMNLQPLEVEQFIFSSTMLVHAPSEPGARISEDSPIEPKWDYPKSKWETERLIWEQGASLRHAILRIAGVYDDGC